MDKPWTYSLVASTLMLAGQISMALQPTSLLSKLNYNLEQVAYDSLDRGVKMEEPL